MFYFINLNLFTLLIKDFSFWLKHLLVFIMIY